MKNPWYTIIQHCTTLIFHQKLDFCDFFLRKFLLTVFHIFHRKYTPNFQKIDFSIYPNILYFCDQNFMLVPTIKLLELSDKNWETYERLLIFWSIFWLFFSMSKVSNMNFYEKSLIYKIQHCTTLIFHEKLDFCDFFQESFYWRFFTFFIENTPQIFKKSTFPYTPIYYIFVIRILCSFQQSNY